MRVRAIYKSRIPAWFGAAAITLYPFVLFGLTKEHAHSLHVIHHECIHVRQVRKLGWLRFYASYVWEWARSILSGKSHMDAYNDISFENEAFGNQWRIEMTADEMVEFGL